MNCFVSDIGLCNNVSVLYWYEWKCFLYGRDWGGRGSRELRHSLTVGQSAVIEMCTSLVSPVAFLRAYLLPYFVKTFSPPSSTGLHALFVNIKTYYSMTELPEMQTTLYCTNKIVANC